MTLRGALCNHAVYHSHLLWRLSVRIADINKESAFSNKYGYFLLLRSAWTEADTGKSAGLYVLALPSSRNLTFRNTLPVPFQNTVSFILKTVSVLHRKYR